MPIERAVPSMIRHAASSLEALRSFSLIFTISAICALVTLPTLSAFGFALAVVLGRVKGVKKVLSLENED